MSNTTQTTPDGPTDVVTRSHQGVPHEVNSRRGWMWSGRVMRRFAVVATATVVTSIGILGVASAAPNDVSIVSGVTTSERGLAGCPKLSEGDQSDCVRQLQHALNTVNSAYNLKEDSKFGPDTRVAVLDFQGRNHLGADGLVGATTADELARQAQQHESEATPPPVLAPQEDTPQVGTSPGSKHGTNYIHDCGPGTCSDYYSHAATVEYDEALQKGDLAPAGHFASICSLAGGGAAAAGKAVLGSSLLFVCGPVDAAVKTLGYSRDIIHHAATSNGCMRFRSLRGASVIDFAVYADHSSTCHSMD
jgi:peptidoglycan hydrolase-like protein with peptidoglycan-binding domain